MLNNILLCSICAVVIVGTMYPPFADLLLGQKISVGAPFFNATVLPLAIPLFVAMAMGPLLPWKRGRIGPVLAHTWWAALAAFAVAGVASVGMRILPAWRSVPRRGSYSARLPRWLSVRCCSARRWPTACVARAAYRWRFWVLRSRMPAWA